jgi:hypothetical protein
MHYGLPCDGIIDCIGQLLGRETPEHGNDAIVAANGMKSEGKRDEPQSGSGDPAAPEVAHDHSHSCDPIHLAEKSPCFDTREVMQNLRAHCDVDAAVGEREAQRVTANGNAHRLPAGPRELENRIETDGGQLDAPPAGQLSGATGDVAEPGSYIEDRSRGRQVADYSLELVDGRAQSTEKRVGARHVGEGARHQPAIGVRQIENLDAAPPPRCQNRGHDP